MVSKEDFREIILKWPYFRSCGEGAGQREDQWPYFSLVTYIYMCVCIYIYVYIYHYKAIIHPEKPARYTTAIYTLITMMIYNIYTITIIQYYTIISYIHYYYIEYYCII